MSKFTADRPAEGLYCFLVCNDNEKNGVSAS